MVFVLFFEVRCWLLVYFYEQFFKLVLIFGGRSLVFVLFIFNEVRRWFLIYFCKEVFVDWCQSWCWRCLFSIGRCWRWLVRGILAVSPLRADRVRGRATLVGQTPPCWRCRCTWCRSWCWRCWCDEDGAEEEDGGRDPHIEQVSRRLLPAGCRIYIGTRYQDGAWL